MGHKHIQEICEFNFYNFSQKKYNEAKQFLIEKIDTYLEVNAGSNLINMAKSSGFTEFLKNELATKYN